MKDAASTIAAQKEWGYLSQDSWCQGRDSKRSPLEYEYEASPIEPTQKRFIQGV
jgi:hypothetical protein